MRIILTVISIASLFISGCTVGPDYCAPTVPKTKKYTQQDNFVTKEQRIVINKKLQTEWWKLFASEPLNKLIAQGLQDNYDLKTAKKSLAQAEEAINSKKGTLLPQIGINGTVGNQRYGVALFGPTNFNIPTFTYYELGPIASWQIDLFGSTRNQIKQLQALAKYQAHVLDATYISLTSNIVAQALEIAALRAQIAASNQIIAEDKQTLELITKKFEIGSATRLDILNAQTQLDNDSSQLPLLKQNLSMAKHALAILVGQAPGDWEPPEFEFTQFKLPHELPLSLPSQLVHQRPDILAAEANLEAASAMIGVAAANMYPNIIINASLLQEALTPGGLFKAGATAWSVAGSITAPIFSGGTLCAEKRKAEQAYEASLAQYQQIVLHAFEQVANTLTALENDSKSVAVENNYVQAASKSLQLARMSHEIGAIGLLQVLDSKRSYAHAQMALIRAQQQRYLDTAKLFVVLGGSSP